MQIMPLLVMIFFILITTVFQIPVLTIDVKNNNISENLTIDGTNISQLKLAGGTYSGNLVNNGTVSNTGVLNLSGSVRAAAQYI